MTLDEAIKHCEEKAKGLREQAGFDTDNERYRMSESEKADCLECAKEHEQLAEWLKELKALRGDCEYKGGKILKRRSGDYVTYNIEYLLDNLAREIYLLESSRKWKESKIKEERMSREMTNSEAISNLNHIYGIVSPDIQRSLDVAIEALKERPQGEWINTSPYDIKGTCSLCCYLSNKYYNFCPNCGADMKGSEE